MINSPLIIKKKELKTMPGKSVLIISIQANFVSERSEVTPPRTPRISRLKSQIMKPTFLS